MAESLFDEAVDLAIPLVGVPLFAALTIGAAIGSVGVVQQGLSNGDTTLNLAARRARSCEAFDDVREKLDSQSEAQAIVNKHRSTDAVCYMGTTATGLTWYSTGGH